MDIKLFQQKLNDICAIAEENNKQLSQQQIRDHFDESEDVYKRQIPTCSQQPLWKISATESWMPQMRRLSQQQSLPTPTVSSAGFRRVIIPFSAETVQT